MNRKEKLKIAKREYKESQTRKFGHKSGRLKIAEKLIGSKIPNWGGIKISLL